MNDLNTKILEKEDFIDKLVQVEKKFERVITIEKDFCDKSSAIETLISKVDALEDKLCEKDNIIKDLTEKVNSLLENENIETVADELEVSENEKTFCNPSEVLKNCPHCKFETKSTDDIAKHIRTKHEIRCPHCSFVTYLKEDLENHLRNKHEKKELKCDYCEFIGKTSSGLKAHLTKMHTGVKKFNCFTCDFCCETKVELVTHNDIYWYSHRQCLNRDHERYILGEFVQLEQDGFKVHRKLYWTGS